MDTFDRIAGTDCAGRIDAALPKRGYKHSYDETAALVSDERRKAAGRLVDGVRPAMFADDDSPTVGAQISCRNHGLNAAA